MFTVRLIKLIYFKISNLNGMCLMSSNMDDMITYRAVLPLWVIMDDNSTFF